MRYPAYQIAIFKVTAPAGSSVICCCRYWVCGWNAASCQEEIIRKRVADRAKQTGRSIPESTLVASIEAVERLDGH